MSQQAVELSKLTSSYSSLISPSSRSSQLSPNKVDIAGGSRAVETDRSSSPVENMQVTNKTKFKIQNWKTRDQQNSKLKMKIMHVTNKIPNSKLKIRNET